MSEAFLEVESVDTRQRRRSHFDTLEAAEREARIRRKSDAENEFLTRVERSKYSGYVVRSVPIEYLVVPELKSALLGERARGYGEK